MSSETPRNLTYCGIRLERIVGFSTEQGVLGLIYCQSSISDRQQDPMITPQKGTYALRAVPSSSPYRPISTRRCRG
jgi:hypothetical protein